MTSVLFGDLVGFTTISEARDPEEVRELLSRYFDTAREIVARYGGVIEKFIGDAVMAVWGVPTAHEDDAERAVRAGLDLVDAVAAFGDEVGVPGLAMRVGIVTGEVAVTIGATNQGMVAGDAVNTAARVQSKAEPGTVWIDAQTRSLVAGAVDAVDAGVHELKGKADPVRLFAVTSVKAALGGEPGTDQVRASLVGRRRELSVLTEVFHGVAEQHRPRLVLLSGDAGVGKTRLSWELERYLDGLTVDVLWHRGRCPAYGDGIAFSALTSAVRARIGSTEHDDENATREKLVTALEKYVPDVDEREWLEPALAGVLGLPTAGARSQADLFAAWLTWFERLSSQGLEPVVWVIDDAHHADDALLDFVEHVSTVAQAALLVVVLARPELLQRRPGLALLRRASVIGVENLTRAEMEALLDSLIEGLPDDVRDALVDRAEGNPLFAIETVRAMHDQGLTVAGPTRTPGAVQLSPGVDAETLKAVAAPVSLQVLIASRLDRLPPAARSVLAAASVLGQSFTVSALAATCDVENELPDLLRELMVRDLLTAINDRLSGEDGQYAFVQTVARTVAYQTQSRRDRLHRHLKVVNYLESIVDTDGALCAVIAEHLRDAFALAGSDESAMRQDLAVQLAVWLRRSAERSLAVGAPVAALSALEQALEFVDDDARRAELYVAAAEAALAAGLPDRGVEHALPVATGELEADLAARAAAAACAAQGLRYLTRVSEVAPLLEPYVTEEAIASLPALAACRVARQLAIALNAVGRQNEAPFWEERATLLAEASGDPLEIASCLNSTVVGLINRGQTRVGSVLVKYVAEYCREHRLAVELGPTLVNQLAINLNRDLDGALAAGCEALDVAKQTGNKYVGWHGALNLVIGLARAGRWDQIEETLDKPLLATDPEPEQATVMGMATITVALARDETLAEPTHWYTVELGDDPTADNVDTLYALLERVQVARLRRDGAALAASCRRMVPLCYSYMGLEDDFPLYWSVAINWLLDLGEVAPARELLTVVLDVPPAHWSPYLAAVAVQLRGTVEALDPQSGVSPAAIESDLNAAVAALGDFGAVPDNARAQATLGRWLAAQGRLADAELHLVAARAMYERLGATAWLRELETGARFSG
jgi:class 3 adenylate cyclase/tetratricopeptide (TPR) repeat protein